MLTEGTLVLICLLMWHSCISSGINSCSDVDIEIFDRVVIKFFPPLSLRYSLSLISFMLSQEKW
jgi:hypothetical protein